MATLSLRLYQLAKCALCSLVATAILFSASCTWAERLILSCKDGGVRREFYIEIAGDKVWVDGLSYDKPEIRETFILWKISYAGMQLHTHKIDRVSGDYTITVTSLNKPSNETTTKGSCIKIDKPPIKF
jgi:hypothetical protein